MSKDLRRDAEKEFAIRSMKNYKDLSESEKSVIDGLNETIHKLREQVKELYPFKERYEHIVRRAKSLEEALHQKHNTVRILERKKEGIYARQIIKLDDTSEGLFIEIQGE